MAVAPTTQCPFCGAPLTVEGDFCPNCGSKKQQFTEHRAHMKAYKKAFEDTKNTVVAENRRDSKKAASIAIIAVLVALILGEIIVTRFSYRIVERYQASVAKKNSRAILTALDESEKTEQFELFYMIWTENSLRYLKDDSGFREYYGVYAITSSYNDFISSIAYMQNLAIDPESDYEGFEKGIERKAQNVVYAYNSFLRRYESYVENFKPDDKYYTYHPDGFSEKHMETYRKIKENARYMISYYFDIPLEDMDDFDKLSEAKMTVRLTEALEAKYAAKDNE
ncbi:MAG: zinc ribbon domain-containing protein [Lachnospiraceae bacterium]|nr:zinc ribbon domain-containing protein [Lachnospiraceae bacterium]